MKRSLCLLLALALLLALSACAKPGEGPVPGQNDAPAPEEAAMYLKVAEVYDGSFLGMGMGDRATAGELYLVPTAGVPFTEDKTLAPGTLVTVFYDGMVQETYPAQIAAPTSIAWSGERDDMVGFYFGVLKELYEQDAALNDGITMLGFDLSGAANLSEAEKAALMYLLGCEYGLEPVSGTFDELCEAGYIDKEKLYFPEGVLLTISVEKEESDKKFTFSVSKWRGGLGAIGMNECEARHKDGVWSYTPGGMWIS